MRLDRGGLILGGIYTAIFLFLIALSFFSQNAKGEVTFAQLAVFPAMIAVTFSGLEALLVNSWLNNTFAFYLLSLEIVYLTGWTVHLVIRLLVRAQLSRSKSE